MDKEKLNIKCKIWYEIDGKPVFGEGRLRLLKAIETNGSIRKAADELSMSYRAAWGKIRASEERLGKKLLDIKKGGSDGGGATLTDYAKKIIVDYKKLKENSNKLIKEHFKK